MANRLWNPEYRAFQDQIRTVRKAAGLTQIALSEKLGKPQSYVSKYESGERNLDLIEVIYVCQACGYAVDDFVLHLQTTMAGEKR